MLYVALGFLARRPLNHSLLPIVPKTAYQLLFWILTDTRELLVSCGDSTCPHGLLIKPGLRLLKYCSDVRNRKEAIANVIYVVRFRQTLTIVKLQSLPGSKSHKQF